MHEKTPVIVGVGQVSQRAEDPLQADEPLLLMQKAAEAAAEDAGSRRLLQSVESIRVVRGVWRYGDPGRFLAETWGLPKVHTLGTPFGGNQVQSVINLTARQLLSSDLEAALLVGAETGHSRARARKAGLTLQRREVPGQPDEVTGEDSDMSHPAESARGMRLAIQYYPIFETALRHARGEAPAAHLQRIAELWSGFSAVAEKNPHAWLPRFHAAETLLRPGPANRAVSFPYPKLMNSNNAVDMGAALLLCTLGFAKRHGIPQQKWVFPQAGTDASDHYFVSHRDNLYSSPAIRLAGARLFELAGLDAADMDLVDIYSCFPSAVQVAAEELGLAESRPLTVTGGLTFGGGPLNNYVMHSVARMAELCRREQEHKGLITANGGYLTKHAMGIYSASPPEKDFAWASPQQELDQLPKRSCHEDYTGEARLEAYTVMFGREGASLAHCACLTAEGARTWANTDEPEVLQAMQTEEFCGRPVLLRQGQLKMAG